MPSFTASDYAQMINLRQTTLTHLQPQAIPTPFQSPTVSQISNLSTAATAWNDIGISSVHLHQLNVAQYAFQQALAIQRQINNLPGQSELLDNMGKLDLWRGTPDVALQHFQDALGLREKVSDRRGLAHSHLNMGWAYHQQGHLEEAKQEYDQARKLSEETGDASALIATLEAEGQLLEELGQPDEALERYQVGLEMARKEEDKQNEAAMLVAIGQAYQTRGKYDVALAHFNEALAVLHELGDWKGVARVQNDIGLLYMAVGHCEFARGAFEEVLALMQSLEDAPWVVAVLNNLALVDYYQGRLEEALERYEQVRQVMSDLGDMAGEAAALNNMGAIYQAQGRYDEAEDVFQQALSLMTGLGHQPGIATAHNNLGGLYAARRHYEAALTEYQEALKINQTLGQYPEVAITLSNIGQVYEARGAVEQALTIYEQAIEIVETVRSYSHAEELQASYAARFAELYVRAVVLLMRLGREDDAFHYAERARSRTFLDLLGNQRVNPRGSEIPQLVEREVQLRATIAALDRQLGQEWAKPVDERSPSVIESLTADLKNKRQEYAALLTDLQAANPEYAALVTVAPLTLEEAHALLQDQAPDITLVSYFVGQEEIVIFIVSSETFHAEIVSITRQELRQQVETLRAQMKAEPLLPDAWQEPGQALYEWLIAPVQKYLPHASAGTPPHLGIIPHDLLHYLPFGLLYDGKYTLLEGYSLFYAPSISSLRFIFDKRHPEADTLLGFANPDAPGAPHLRYAVEEAQTVAGLYGTQPLIGPEATEGVFKAQAGQYGLIHVAAHSDYNPRSPLFSAILLQADESEDGRLETHEVFNLDLPQTDLVVLSACETHLGELSAGDELVGLERAFIRAGSPSLLTTLWPVDDAATATLMEQFYAHLRAGVPKAEALRLAQMETRAEHPEPYYWVGFVLVGDSGLPFESTLTPQPALVEATPTPQPTPTGGKGSGGLCGGPVVLPTVVGVLGWQRRRQSLRGKGAG